MDNRATIEQLVRVRAHELWLEAGRPKGREKTFWPEARKQVIHSGAASKIAVPNADLDQAGEDSFPASDPVNRT
ncbi:DUF2934 domain-containing protein [Acidocella sp.]|jgi:hypothetical protein|uniref:DUF2934 domain-containing protein n=1 Tax=Acidocella sp. TaxID=50710 RepID=UPI002F3F9815